MVSQDPTAGLRNDDPDIPRDRVFPDPEIRSAWQALDDASCDEKIKIIIRLAFLLGKRRSEIVNAYQDGLDLVEFARHGIQPGPTFDTARSPRSPSSRLAS